MGRWQMRKERKTLIAINVAVGFWVTVEHLWRLIIASLHPNFWAKQRTDGGEVVQFNARQLGGVD
jgi:hypothetical protein